jgi:predicted aspartyl protease
MAGKSYLSSTTQGEYECAQRRDRTLVDTGFSSIMGLGAVVYNESFPREWASIIPRRLGQTLWNFAGGKH